MIYAKYVNEDSGREYDQILCKQYLNLNKMYEVDDVIFSECSTYIKLKDFCFEFNSVNFEFYVKKEDNMLPFDIYHNEIFI